METRKAKLQDMDYVHSCIVRLADLTGGTSDGGVKITTDTLKADFEAGSFDVIVCEVDGAVVGMALYYMAYSTWKGKMLYLASLFVEQDFRRQGLGQQLFNAVVAEAKDIGISYGKWQVARSNVIAQEFYQAYGVETEDDVLDMFLAI